jgi:hypothetical protein
MTSFQRSTELQNCPARALIEMENLDHGEQFLMSYSNIYLFL